ncbi:hypothetical protein CDD83_7151 [Cordyceps sp. RAO-2017]|nr:hypothetical protein CDD83_7151 [Cordyceps sp. RAO-2017]
MLAHRGLQELQSGLEALKDRLPTVSRSWVGVKFLLPLRKPEHSSLGETRPHQDVFKFDLATHTSGSKDIRERLWDFGKPVDQSKQQHLRPILDWLRVPYSSARHHDIFKKSGWSRPGFYKTVLSSVVVAEHGKTSTGSARGQCRAGLSLFRRQRRGYIQNRRHAAPIAVPAVHVEVRAARGARRGVGKQRVAFTAAAGEGHGEVAEVALRDNLVTFLKLLLGRGADINTPPGPGYWNAEEPPVHRAARRCTVDKVRALAGLGADVDRQCHGGLTALRKADGRGGSDCAAINEALLSELEADWTLPPPNGSLASHSTAREDSKGVFGAAGPDWFGHQRAECLRQDAASLGGQWGSCRSHRVAGGSRCR